MDKSPPSSDWLERLTVECSRRDPIQPLISAGPLFKSGGGDQSITIRRPSAFSASAVPVPIPLPTWILYDALFLASVEPIAVLLLAVGLAMDAFAVSVCKGLAIGRSSVRAGIIVGAWFGFFQFLMPVIGYYIGDAFSGAIEDYDHWVAFALLAVIGANMIHESRSEGSEDVGAGLGFAAMLFFAVATSIDALATGISLAMVEDSIWVPAAVIGAVTFAMSFVGTYIGCRVSGRLGPAAELIGGIILILIGISVPLEHLGYI